MPPNHCVWDLTTEIDVFYCDECRDKNEWPSAFMQSYGKCEICDITGQCHDTPSHNLPERKQDVNRDISHDQETE